MPVIMLTTTDDEKEIEKSYELGCNFYMVKPTDYRKFIEAVENLGTFVSTHGLRVPPIGGTRVNFGRDNGTSS